MSDTKNNKMYGRKANATEREAFADAFRFFERFANTASIEIGNQEQENNFAMFLVADSDGLCRKSELHKALCLAIEKYLDEQLVNRRENSND